MTQPIIITNDCVAMLQAITADEPTLRTGLPLTHAECDELALITHPAQRVEWLACRVAIRELVERQGDVYRGVRKDEFGKPHLVGVNQHISLSHTAGWAAAALHRTNPVGIDVEPIREQFRRVVPRVLSKTEIVHAANDLNRLAMYWCAKEALYKLYGKRQLTFREHLLIDPFADGADLIMGHVRLPNYEEQLTIRCIRTAPGLLAVAY